MRAEAILRLLRTLAGPVALLLGLEDLQWADPDTLTIVEYLADNIRAEHILCVITVRPEPASPPNDLVQALNARRTARILSLARLSDEDTRRMVLACRPSARPDDLRDIVRAADGVPFLVEEMLATPGVPATFAASAAARMAHLDPAERRVIQLAAALGRQFDWRLLQAASDQEPQIVGAALENAVASLLLTVHGGGYQFRHALTREAIIDGLLPHLRAELARTALAALKQAGPAMLEPNRDLAADLAEQAGDADEAARLLIGSGRESLRRGALATATATLRRAADLAGDDSLRRTANALLTEALALAGRLDECLTAGSAALRVPAPATRAAPAETAMIHLAIAHAAVEATRWPVAADHLAAAQRLLAANSNPAATQRWRVLAAETALARRDLAGVQQLAELVLGSAIHELLPAQDQDSSPDPTDSVTHIDPAELWVKYVAPAPGLAQALRLVPIAADLDIQPYLTLTSAVAVSDAVGPSDRGRMALWSILAVGTRELDSILGPVLSGLNIGRSLTIKVRRLLVEQVEDTLSRSLDMSLSEMILTGWNKRSDLTSAMSRTREEGAQEEIIHLPAHKMEVTFEQPVDLLVDGQPVARLSATVDVGCEIGPSVVVVRNGLIVQARGETDVHAQLMMQGMDVADAQRHLELADVFEAA